uniref:PHD-type domain-containing protein n=1 Tax=Cacopsylla melanoneura TaxID=428564 RepID=A0A8D8SSN0_9HEMI
MTRLCGRCNDGLPLTDEELDFATCSACNQGYHFECTTVKDSSWSTMGPDRRSSWKCLSCRNSLSTKGTKQSNVVSTPEGKDRSSDNKDDVVALIESLSNKFTALEKNFNTKMKEFGESMTFYGGKIEELANSIKIIEKKNIVLEKRLDVQETENKELKTKVKYLEGMMQQRDQKDQATKLEISGFKDIEIDENGFMKKIIELTGIEDNVQFRVEKIVRENKDKKTGKNQSLIVQFKSEEIRNDVLTKIKDGKIYNKVGEIIRCQSPVKLFFNEYLTPYYKKLLFEAKKLKMDKQYAFLWVKSGKILFKKQKESKIESLLCMDDLKKM